jgi:hypothetical protein
MDVRNDGDDSPALASRQFGAPCSGVEMLQDDLIHSLIYGITLHQYLAKVDADIGL